MSLVIESISESRGTPWRRVRPSAMRQAARMGSEEFLLPEISILPLRRVPPRIRKLSMMPFLGSETQNVEQGASCLSQNANDTFYAPQWGISTDPSANDQSMLKRFDPQFIGRIFKKGDARLSAP